VTLLCGGGTSSAKAGFGASLALGAASIAALLNNVPTPWAVPLAAYIGLLTYDLSTFCTTDPPAIPTITLADAVDVIQIADPVARVRAQLKFQDLVGAYLWHQVCQCDVPPQPAIPAPPATPSPWISINPPAIAPCWSSTLTYVATTVNSPQYRPLLFNTSTTDPFGAFLPFPLPTAVTVTTTVNTDGVGLGSYQFVLVGRNSPGGANFTSVGFGPYAAGTTHTDVITLDPRVTFAELETLGTTVGATNSVTVTVSWNCTPIDVTTSQLCCPEVYTLSDQVQQLLGMVQAIYTGLPQSVNSYAEATVHAGLTGNGTLTLVDHAIAIKVHITADTTGGRTAPGVPPYLFDRGWIVPIAAEGPLRGLTRLVYDPQLYPLPPLTEQIGYTLTPGITATITELVRGP
jgi:hypothetical protein